MIALMRFTLLFQAEDGIQYYKVTGVQTCALPISGVVLFCSTKTFLDARIELDRERLLALAPDVDVPLVESHLSVIPIVCRGGDEIGRASCRDGVWVEVGSQCVTASTTGWAQYRSE